MNTDILSPADFAIVSKMAVDQGYGSVLQVAWRPDDNFIVPVILTKTGKTLALYCLPDGSGGWRKLYRRRTRANGMA